jgi:predicted transcriptional regulator
LVADVSPSRSTILRATLIRVAENQNITLSVPRDVLRRVKRLAADRDTSVSALMTEALARLSDDDRRYSAARKRALAAMKTARSLGTRGQRTWTRDGLHER